MLGNLLPEGRVANCLCDGWKGSCTMALKVVSQDALHSASAEGDGLAVFRLRRKWRCWCPFLVAELVL